MIPSLAAELALEVGRSKHDRWLADPGCNVCDPAAHAKERQERKKSKQYLCICVALSWGSSPCLLDPLNFSAALRPTR